MITFDTEQVTFDSLDWTFDGWSLPTDVQEIFSVTTDRSLFRTTLIEWLKSYAGISNVIFANQETKRPPKPYGTIFFPSGTLKSGFDEEIQVFNSSTQLIERITHGPCIITVQVEIYTDPASSAHGQEAYELLENALLSLDTSAVRETLRQAKIGVLESSEVQRMDEQLGERWERRALAELTLSYSGETMHNGGGGFGNWIETAEIPTEQNGNSDYES